MKLNHCGASRNLWIADNWSIYWITKTAILVRFLWYEGAYWMSGNLRTYLIATSVHTLITGTPVWRTSRAWIRTRRRWTYRLKKSITDKHLRGKPSTVLFLLLSIESNSRWGKVLTTATDRTMIAKTNGKFPGEFIIPA